MNYVNEDYINYIAVPYKGRHYMCVGGSPRADILSRANKAWTMGYDDLASRLLAEATKADGCAFAHRELHNG